MLASASHHAGAARRAHPPPLLHASLLLSVCLAGCTDDARPAGADAADRSPRADAGAGRERDAAEPDARVPRWTAHACAMPIPERLSAQDYRCGTLTVAADREQPGGATLAIEVAVLAASGGEPRPDPVLFIGGGPGASTLDGYLWTHSARILAPLRATRDIVFFDQRGTGRSRPSLACPEQNAEAVASLTRNDSPEQASEATLRGFAECHARLLADGIDLSVYHSAAVAQDVGELMQALAYDEYNVYGISHGGRIAQTVLRDQPARVRSAILDASVLPEANVAGAAAAGLNAALRRFFADCLELGACEADLEARLYEAYALLGETPFVSSPLEKVGGAGVVINGHRALVVVHGMLSRERTHALPALIGQLADGRYDLLELAAPELVPDPARATMGFFASVLCAEELPFENEETLARTTAGVRSELIEARSGTYDLELCRTWPVPARPALENEPITSDIPTLILHGSYDPSVHPSASERAHENLDNSQHFVFPGVGHGVLRSSPGDAEQPSCAQRMALAFLDDPHAAVDGSCLNGSEP